MVLRPQAFKRLSNGAKSGLLALFKRSTMSCVSVLSKLAVASLCLSPAGRVPHLRLFPWARRNRNAAWKKSIGFLNVNKLTVHHFCQAAFGKERGTDTDSDEALVHADRPGKKDILDSGLYLVATPIGNLEDITLRALHVLRSANLILSEDTRHSRKLLQYHNIRTPLMSYHKFNESSRQATILQRLRQGQIVAVISDAGTPGICDPGAKIAKVCIDEKFRVIPIPGPCAVISALAASGLPTAEFSFVGFLPIHNNSRKKRLMAAADEAATQIFYVPPHRLHQFLEESISIFGQSRCCVIAREMTKLHEEFWRGTLAEAKSEFSQRNPRGEITFLIQGQENHHADAPSETELERELQYLMSNGQSTSEVNSALVRLPISVQLTKVTTPVQSRWVRRSSSSLAVWNECPLVSMILRRRAEIHGGLLERRSDCRLRGSFLPSGPGQKLSVRSRFLQCSEGWQTVRITYSGRVGISRISERRTKSHTPDGVLDRCGEEGGPGHDPTNPETTRYIWQETDSLSEESEILNW